MTTRNAWISQQKQPSHVRQTGFTLIELLVTISIIAMLSGILLPSLRRARETAQRQREEFNRNQVHAWLEAASERCVWQIIDHRHPFEHATDLPASILDRVSEIDRDNPDHLVLSGYDIYYSWSYPPPEFRFEAVPREPGLTGSTILFSYYNGSLHTAAEAALYTASTVESAAEGTSTQYDGFVIEECYAPGSDEARDNAFEQSASEAMKLLGELAEFLTPQEQQLVPEVMTSPDGLSTAFDLLDVDGDGILTGAELSAHSDPLVNEVLRRVMGPMKFGVAGEDGNAFALSKNDLDFNVLDEDQFPSYDGLASLFEGFVAAPRTGKSFFAKLKAAANAESRGNSEASVGILTAAKKEVRAQSGKALDDGEAQTILNLLDIFIARVRSK